MNELTLVKTRYGYWRQVVAWYADGSLGTIKAEGNSAGTWRVLWPEDVAEKRLCNDDIPY